MLESVGKGEVKMSLGIIDWKVVPTTSVHQSRLQVFQPTRRPTDTKRRIETPWGHANIKGRLGQTHADLIESFCKCAEDFMTDEQGRLHVLVDPQDVRKMMAGGAGHARYPLNRIEVLLEDIMSSIIELNVPAQKIKILGHIIDKVTDAPTPRRAKNGTERNIWVVIFSDTFAQLLEDDLQLHYNPAPITALKTGVAQAIARQILTHKDEPNGGWKIDSLLESVGVDMSKNAMVRQRRAEVRSDSEGLKNLGIIIDDDRIHRAGGGEACSKGQYKGQSVVQRPV